MRRSIALGHCVCDPRKACPCDEFKTHNICHCAGERRTPTSDTPTVNLTEHVRNPGCASKISKGVLHEALQGLPELNDPRVLVGATCGDDAGVIDLGEKNNSILTVDVFSPVVDDPYTFGQIAAANSLSDIYAMGGTPQAALSIIGFPTDTLPIHAMREILRGGADKMNEAGVPIIGGHSINDPEPKCGFAVLGTCPPNQYIRNAGAQTGDVLILTKPLGTGIAAFAKQIGRANDALMAQVAQSMATLNRTAAETMIRHNVHAATDVTGFSLLGHLAEIVKNSNVEVQINFESLPLFEGIRQLANNEVLPGAVERNRESVPESLLDLETLSIGDRGILCGPETSGGILAFIPSENADAFLRDLPTAHIIGTVTRLHPTGKIRVRNAGILPATPQKPQEPPMSPNNPDENIPCCCSSVVAPPDSDLPQAAYSDAFKTYMAAVSGAGALSVKHKKLMGLALSIVTKCEPCVKLHAKASREAGATEQEIAESAALGIAFGGASAAMFYTKARNA
ncbi:MAG: selenide, water dikinase SelD [Phycisphaerales bacterium]|nr:selenide, water dikinase SelD [Phycisphaerales bacterium]